MEKRKLAKKLNETFGDESPQFHIVMPKQFLENLSNLLTKQNALLVEQIQKNNVPPELVEDNRRIKELLREVKSAIENNKIDRVAISNFPEPQPFPELHIPEQKEVKIPPFPNEINLIKPNWYEKAQDRFISFLIDGFQSVKKSFASDLNTHMDKENALAVRLVDATGKTFYDAVVYGGGGSGGGSIDISTLAKEATLATLVAKDFATETTLAALAAADFATETTLSAINGKITAINTGAVVVSSQPARDRATDNIGVAQQTDAIMNDTTVLTPKFKKIDTASSADIIALVSSKKIRVLAGFLTVASDTTIKWQSGGSTDLTGAMTVKSGGGFVMPFNPLGYFETASGEKLNMVLGTAVQVSGVLTYVEV